ncbi:MAG: LytR C-terminal domain-containing protein [Geodermatophilaceae bacterium]|nr:LytR C-terminal domain-containing protein [Geodermatophilaceae bacterium]
MAPDYPTASRPPPGYGSPTPARPGGAGTATRTAQAPPPVRRRVSSRRPIPPLIFLVVLAVVALGVWFKVLQTDQARSSSEANVCPTPPTVTALDPATIQIRVLNATPTAGLAAQVTAEFVGRGFPVTETDNDRSGRTVLRIGELRYGARGAKKAAFVALFVPGVTLVRDTRSDDLIDIALGPEYVGLAAPEAVAIAIATPVAPTDVGCSTGNPSQTVSGDPAATP